MHISEFDKLIAKYLLGNLSKDEFVKLKQHINVSTDEELKETLHKYWEIGEAEEMPEMDLEKTFASISMKNEELERESRLRKRNSGMTLLRKIMLPTAAAAILVLVLLVFKPSEEKTEVLKEVQTAMLDNYSAGNDSACLFFSDQRRIVVRRGEEVVYQVDGTVRVGNRRFSLNKTGNFEDSYHCLTVPKGQYINLTLSDGTKLCVNSGSKVIYPRLFLHKNREVLMEGEAFFDVTHKDKQAFLVHTRHFKVRVLGTAFNINAYEGSSVKDNEVVLVRGKIHFQTNHGDEVLLAPNDKVSLKPNGTLLTGQVDATRYILWTKGIMELADKTLLQNLSELSRYYGIKIDCDPGIREVSLGGKVDLSGGLQKVLLRIASAGGFEVAKTADGYQILDIKTQIK